MILSSRPDEVDPEVLIEEDLSVDPPMVSVYVKGRIVSIKKQEEGFTLFDVASILTELGVGFDYQEIR